jgi:hypothetical protein
MSHSISAHPRESGDPGVFRYGERASDGGLTGNPETQKAWVPTFAGMSGVLEFVFASPALAHEGHHEAMSATQGLQHLLSQPDHQLELAGLVVVAVIGGWFWVRARARR